ncbi:MAG: sugar phosphate nucleotidyltransferase [Polyangiaceae bacterium]
MSDLDIEALVRFHKAHGKVATVTAVHPPGRFGEMGLDGDLVREFNEKPQATEGFINGGFFVFDAKRIWTTSGRIRRPSSSASRCSASPRTISSPPTSTPASGSRWTPCVSTRPGTTLGARRGAVEEVVVTSAAKALGDAYRGKRVLVTGHTGFKGRGLAGQALGHGRQRHPLRARARHLTRALRHRRGRQDVPTRSGRRR